MSKEREPNEVEMQRLSHLVLMAIEAKEREMTDGEFSGKEFVILESEPAQTTLRWCQGLKKHVDFVVAYGEGERIKYSVVDKFGGDEVEVIEPAISTISIIPSRQFESQWAKTNYWLMMVRK